MQEDTRNNKLPYADQGDGFSVDSPEKRLDQIKSLLLSTQHSLDKITRVVDKIQQDQKKEMYKKMPGIEGVFDGVNLICDNGEKHEVPANYAAKSRLVFGDRLKIVEEDGKKVFKQITKVERKEIKGILSKKEGKWYLLSDSGTYKISDIAAEFNRAELNEEAVGLIPLDQPNVPFAALDLIIRKEVPKQETSLPSASHPKNDDKDKQSKPEKKVGVGEKKQSPATAKPFIRQVPEKKFEEAKPVSKPAPKSSPKPAPKPVTVTKTEDTAKKEYVANLLEDDDLR